LGLDDVILIIISLPDINNKMTKDEGKNKVSQRIKLQIMGTDTELLLPAPE
jgi:hypothetical protein